MITKFIINVASVVHPVLAAPNFLAYIRKKGSKEVRCDFTQIFSIFVHTVQERGSFSDPRVALLAPISGSFLQEKMSHLIQHVYSMICKTKWQNTVLSIPFMKNKLKKDLFHKIDCVGEKIKMNEQGRKGN